MPYLREIWLSMQQQLGQEAATGGVLQKMVFLKKTSNFTGKHVFWTCARPATLLKSNSNTGVSV